MKRETSLEKTRTSIEYTYPELLAWYSCGETLLEYTDIPPRQYGKILRNIGTASIDKSRDFLTLVMAVIATESAFNAGALSSTGALGLMQLTHIGAQEGALQCGLYQPSRKRLLNDYENVKYGSCLLKYYLDSVNGDILQALILYNGGYKQLTRFLKSGTLTKETGEYVIRVNHFLRKCKP